MARDFCIKTLQEAALSYLAEHLDRRYSYHNAVHSQDVCAALEEFLQSTADPFEPSEREALQIAAIFHDFGYLVRPDENEICCREYVQMFGKEFALPPALQVRAMELIMETAFPYRPISAAGKLLCDADIEYIGRDIFWQRAADFRQELAAQGQVMTDLQWYCREVEFLRSNAFFTDTANRLRGALRMENLRQAEARLQKLAREKI